MAKKVKNGAVKKPEGVMQDHEKVTARAVAYRREVGYKLTGKGRVPTFLVHMNVAQMREIDRMVSGSLMNYFEGNILAMSLNQFVEACAEAEARLAKSAAEDSFRLLRSECDSDILHSEMVPPQLGWH